MILLHIETQFSVKCILLIEAQTHTHTDTHTLTYIYPSPPLIHPEAKANVMVETMENRVNLFALIKEVIN